MTNLTNISAHICLQQTIYIFSEKLLQDLENTYSELTYIFDESYWGKHIYKTMTLPQPADFLDCSMMCRNVEKPNGCDLFLMEVQKPNILFLFPYFNT